MVDDVTLKAWQIHFNGIVQGVGFRPFIFRLAAEMKIKGWVNNSSQGVNIHAEGHELEIFYQRITREVPPLARITEQHWNEVPFMGYGDFRIVESQDGKMSDVLISPDVAVCSDCLEEVLDPENRRYHYPFANCTNCGPRYTIIQAVPYDRKNTTMASFTLCSECREEYENPLDRRFHAQPVACARCGPGVELLDAKGQALPGLGIEQLAAGAIVAIKGLGGFHLVCDASNDEAVRRLRATKERGDKPLAVMARSIKHARREVKISKLEEELLHSPAAPIVITERKMPNRADSASRSCLSPAIAPGMNTLGVLLPYTPLHHLLFEGPFDFLVMTSANLSGEPLIYENEAALAGLRGIADYFLIHNRAIYHPCDDSVVLVIGGEPVFIRRARGYVPLPIFCASKIETELLAVGGELKNAFCLAQGTRAFVSQYIGDMEQYANFQRFEQELCSFQQVTSIAPRVVVHDAHPNYQTTRFALGTAWPKVKVQHHHAHLVSVLGEHGRNEATLGIICDGTGYGEDGKIWGFEFLWGNAQGFERRAHLEYLPLPGGDAGAKKPLRIAYAYLKTLFTPQEWKNIEPLGERLWAELTSEEKRILDWQLQSKVQLFQTSSAGRLFDAVSALLGICTKVTYEGQAAMELEAVATSWIQEQQGHGVTDGVPEQVYTIDIRAEQDGLVLGLRDFFRELVDDILAEKSPGEIAYRFHLAIAEAMVETVVKLGNDGPLVISGGVFQNKLLTERVMQICQAKNIEVLRARALPPGDGGLSFGQILVASEVLKECV